MYVLFCLHYFMYVERPREAQRGQRGPDMPREAQRGPERPERPRDAQRGSFLFCHRVHICQDWAPPVATLLHTHVLHLILSHHFSGRRLFRLSFLFCHKTCIFCFHFISLRHFSGHRLWRLSFLCLGHRQWRPLCVISFCVIASFLWAPPQFSVLS